MRRTIIAFVLGGLLGLPTGAFLWYAFSPLLFDTVVSETLAEARPLATGTFRDADRTHSGTGTATIVEFPDGRREVQFTGFEVTNGPDLEVWLSAHPDPSSSSDVANNPWFALGQLRGNIGDQAYAIPEGVDLSAYRSVVIWCERFGVLFSPASLSPSG